MEALIDDADKKRPRVEGRSSSVCGHEGVRPTRFESGREQFNESPAHVSCAEVPIVSRRRLVTLSHQQGSAREVQCRELPR